MNRQWARGDIDQIIVCDVGINDGRGSAISTDADAHHIIRRTAERHLSKDVKDSIAGIIKHISQYARPSNRIRCHASNLCRLVRHDAELYENCTGIESRSSDRRVAVNLLTIRSRAGILYRVTGEARKICCVGCLREGNHRKSNEGKNKILKHKTSVCEKQKQAASILMCTNQQDVPWCIRESCRKSTGEALKVVADGNGRRATRFS